MSSIGEEKAPTPASLTPATLTTYFLLGRRVTSVIFRAFQDVMDCCTANVPFSNS